MKTIIKEAIDCIAEKNTIFSNNNIDKNKINVIETGNLNIVVVFEISPNKWIMKINDNLCTLNREKILKILEKKYDLYIQNEHFYGKDYLCCGDRKIQVRRYVEGVSGNIGCHLDLFAVLKAVHKLQSIKIENIEIFNYIDEVLDKIIGLINMMTEFHLSNCEKNNIMKYISTLIENYIILSRNKVITQTEAYVISHGDMNNYNFIFENHQLVGIIDWDDVGVRPRIFDLAKILLLWSRLTNGEFEIDRTKMNIILNYYKKKMNLSVDEINLLPVILVTLIIPNDKTLITLSKKNRLTWILNWTNNAQRYITEKLSPVVKDFLRKEEILFEKRKV